MFNSKKLISKLERCIKNKTYKFDILFNEEKTISFKKAPQLHWDFL